MESNTRTSPLATRPILYTDTLAGVQTCRDDLWAVTTEELNAAARAAPGVPAVQPLAERALLEQCSLILADAGWRCSPPIAGLRNLQEKLSIALAAPAGISQQAGGAVPEQMGDRNAALRAAPADLRRALYLAAIDCGHQIEENMILLHRDHKLEGNALSQLADRLAAVVAQSGAAASGDTSPEGPNPALAVPVQADRIPEPQLCDFGNPDDFIDAHADWSRQKKDEQIGAAEYKGNTISYMYSKAKNYGNVLVECCNLLGGDGHVIDRIKALLAERDRLAATPVAPPASPSDPIRDLIAAHAERLEANPYCYFELAHTRHTGWMAWLCTNSIDLDKDRKVIARGQGDTPEDACADALRALPGSTPDAAQGGA